MVDSTRLTHVAPATGERFDVMGEDLTVRLSAAAVPNLSIIEIISPPGGGPPALHTHPSMEAFYVLEGSYEFEGVGPDGRGRTRASSGSVVYIPGGAPHNYKNVGDGPGRMLAVFTEPAPELFFRALHDATVDADGRPSRPPDMGRVMGVMQSFQVAFVDGPPGR